MVPMASSTEALVETVLEGTNSPNSCSTSTLRLLRALLGIQETESDHAARKQATRPNSQKQATAVTAIKPSKTSARRGNAQFAVLDCPPAPIQCLPRDQQLKLATTTFNKTLKTIGEALKVKRSTTSKTSGPLRSPLKEMQSRTRDFAKTTSKALPSRLAQTTPQARQETRTQATPPPPVSSNLLATAECARTSLQCLRRLKAADTTKKEQDTQLEAGTMVLISKLQGIGLIAAATEETLALRKALDSTLCRKQKGRKHDTKLERPPSYKSLADCIEFEHPGDNAMSFGLITAFQVQVLQLLALDDPPSTHQNLYQRLDHANPRGPCRMILYGGKQGWLSSDKAVQQLHSLCQSVLSICHLASVSAAEMSGDHLCPKELFRLQCTALHLRCHSWHLANHQPDLEKEIWTPFHRFVTLLRRVPGSLTKPHFLLVKRSMDQLLDVVVRSQNVTNSKHTTIQPSSTVLATLQEMADATGLTTESLNLLHSLKASCANLPGLPAAIYSCKIATAMLLDSPIGSDDSTLTIETALDSLERPLKGTAKELLRLLLEAARLRKAAATRLTAISGGSRMERPLEDRSRVLANICLRAIFRLLHLFVRYVSLKPQDNGDSTCSVKYSSKVQSPVSIAQQSLKSVLAAVQLNITHEYIGWELSAEALAHCLSAADILEKHAPDIAEAETGAQNNLTTAVRVSNLHWSRYLKLKDARASEKELASILRNSIEALESRTPSEKKAGFLAIKCDKAAILYSELGQFDRARQILVTAINAHIQTGTLSAAAQRARTHTTRQIWQETDSSGFALGRVLSAHARLLLKHQTDSSSQPFFDDAELPPGERAVLLEKQIISLGECLVPEWLQGRLKTVAESVLSLYLESGYLVHRLRFVSELLSFCARNRLPPRQLLPDEALKICLDEGNDEVSVDDDSVVLSKSVHSSVSLQWAFMTSAPSVSLLEKFLTSHTTVMESCDNLVSVLPSINDPIVVVGQAQSVVDFTDMQGLFQLKLDALLLVRRMLDIQPEKDSSALASCTTLLGLQYTRMGFTNKAGRVLAAAEKLIASCESKVLIALQWHLAYAEYMTVISNLEKAADQLVSAEWQYDADLVADQENVTPGSQLAQHKFLAQAALLASNLAFEMGDLDCAVLRAKQGVKISVRQWTALERLLGGDSSSPRATEGVPKIDLLTHTMSNMRISAGGGSKRLSRNGAAFWPFVQLHFEGFLHLSRLSAYCGNFQDAIYYAEQAKKVAEATSSDSLCKKAFATLAMHFAQAGDDDVSQVMVDRCTSSCGRIDYALGSLQVSMTIAGARLARDELTEGFRALEDAQKTISQIQQTEQSYSPSKSAIKSLPARKAAQSACRTARKASTRHLPSNSVVRGGTDIDGKDMGNEVASSMAQMSILLQRQQAELHLLRSRFCMKAGASDDPGTSLAEAIPLARTAATDAWYYVLQATVKLGDALRLLQSDAVYSVLAESTIAYPTRQRASDVQDDGSGQRRPTTVMPSRSCKKVSNKRAARQDVLSEPRELVRQARDILLVASTTLPACSSTLADELSDLLTRAQLLSSLLSAGPAPSPYLIASQIHAPRTLRWSREGASIRADVVLGEKSRVLTWPQMHGAHENESAGRKSALDHAALQQQLSNGLPPSWNVVHLGLSHDKMEIVVSKLRQGEPPFLLRLPLHRSGSEDLDDEPFSFETAKDELLDIIANANSTAHDSKARSDKQGKKDWWRARELLDGRLMALLHNMETFWLGGFRGIFSDRWHEPELLSRFSESLSRILERGLPSRHKVGSKTESRLELHYHVLELFVGLGDRDDGSLDDAITDLLYFVIDILQFQGERNAYDEVDLDSMVVEVREALRSYRDAARVGSGGEAGHTILVLDKALHSFPWESLPCLEGQAVSRMPSLGCLQERLSRLRRDEGRGAGIWIDAQKGAYILNPSSDLTSTQETFLGRFQSTLAGHTSIVNRAPSEVEFERCLVEKELCLYFGHGSGAQFIRGRTIKRLTQCAVTFLMGCSSSKMVECGQFEPHGVPYNYLQAGSAAVVGTLWDVTDKDIDRFAMSTFVEWGLMAQEDSTGLPPEESPSSSRASKVKSKIGRPRKGEERIRMDGGEEGRQERVGRVVGLDEAVAKARDACVLRYLNGAAPVIYGVPVYLNDRQGY